MFGLNTEGQMLVIRSEQKYRLEKAAEARAAKQARKAKGKRRWLDLVRPANTGQRQQAASPHAPIAPVA